MTSNTPSADEQIERASGSDREAAALKRLARLGIDVSQLASESLPNGVWPVIEPVVRRIRGKRRRWFAAAGMYGRALLILKAGGTVEELTEQFGDPRTLAPLMKDPVLRESVFGSELPTPLQRRLTDVLGRTRLRRDEMITLAGELAERYRAELAAGKTAAEIIRTQEPAPIAARRLRRARLWRRPWWWHIWHWVSRGMQWTAALAAVVYTVLLGRFYLPRAVPRPAEQTDYTYAEAPTQESAWPLYLAGLEQLEGTTILSMLARTANFGPDSANWPEAAAYLKNHRRSLEWFVEGSKRPRIGRVESGAAQAQAGGVLGELQIDTSRNLDQTFLSICSLLACAGRLAAEEQDWSQAARFFAAPVGISRQIWSEKRVNRPHPGQRMDELNRAVQELQKLLVAHGAEIDEVALVEALNQLQTFAPDWHAAFLQFMQQQNRVFLTSLYSAGGRFTGDGFLQMCRDGAGHPKVRWFDSWFTGDPSEISGKDLLCRVVGPCLVPFVVDRDELLAEADRLDELLAPELANPGADAAAIGAFDAEFDRISETFLLQVRYLPLMRLWDARFLKFFLAAQARNWRARSVIVIVLAAELYQRRHGAWPLSAEALVPEILESVPTDELGLPLRLCIIENRPVVYSMGFDGQDNTAEVTTGERRAVDPADVQYFPPVQTGKEK